MEKENKFSFYQIWVGFPTLWLAQMEKKMLYLLAKCKSKDVKMGHFRAAEMKGLMFERVYLIGICNMQYLILDFDSDDSM